MFNIGCYVTSRYSSFNEFSQYMDGCIKKFLPVGKPSALVTGDYKTTKSGNGLVARYAFEHNIPLRRFATMWGKHNPTKPGKRNNAGVASNAQIIKNSNGCVLFWTPTSVAKWDFMSGGCRSFLRMCDAGHLSRPLIQIKVDIYKPDIEAPYGEISPETSADSYGNAGGERSAVGDGGYSNGGISVGMPHGVGGGAPIAPSIGTSSAQQDYAEEPNSENSADSGFGVQSGTATDSGNDVAGNLDVGTTSANTAGEIVKDVPIDIDGDGTPDITVDAVDTDMNGTPDSIIKPVDSDGNGTIDKIELEPIHTVGQIVSANNAQNSAQSQQTQQNQQSAQQDIQIQDDENKNAQPIQ